MRVKFISFCFPHSVLIQHSAQSHTKNKTRIVYKGVQKRKEKNSDHPIFRHDSIHKRLHGLQQKLFKADKHLSVTHKDQQPLYISITHSLRKKLKNYLILITSNNYPGISKVIKISLQKSLKTGKGNKRGQ